MSQEQVVIIGRDGRTRTFEAVTRGDEPIPAAAIGEVELPVTDLATIPEPLRALIEANERTLQQLYRTETAAARPIVVNVRIQKD